MLDYKQGSKSLALYSWKSRIAPKGTLRAGLVCKFMYYVYILKSDKKEKYYIGCTSCIEKRIVEHNKGKTKSTKPYIPWKLIYKESFVEKKQAFKREWHLKHPKGFLEKKNILKNFGGVT